MDERGRGYDPRTGRVIDLTITITDDPSVSDNGDATGQTAHGTNIDHPHSHNSGNLIHTHAHAHPPGDTSHAGHHNVGNFYSPREGGVV